MGKKSQVTTRTYGNTTTKNPYATATTTNGGTTASFNDGTALNSIYNFVNSNIDSLLDEYLNPNLNSGTNQAKLSSFANTLNSQGRKNLENNIINPLSNRNMVRSSQATDLYKNLSNSMTNSLSSYAGELLSNSQDNTAKILNNLLSAYLKGYNVISDMQNQSLKTSSGNATTNSNSGSMSNGLASSSQMMDILGTIAKLFTSN